MTCVQNVTGKREINYERENWRCWYCGGKYPIKKTIFMHVICNCGRSGVRIKKKGELEQFGKPIFSWE